MYRAGGLPQGAGILLQPLAIRLPRAPGVSRRRRLWAAARLRARLQDRRHAARETWAWALLLLWLTSPLETLLSGIDPGAPATAAGAPLYRYAQYAALLLPAAALLQRGDAAWRLARSGWPLVGLAAYAALSIAWSGDPAVSARSLAAAAPLWTAAAAMAVTLRPARAAQAILCALACACLASLAAVVGLPRFAVTGAHDMVGAGAPGAWRGLYLHKNVLGHVAGLAAGALGSRGGRLVRPAALRWGGLGAALACVAMSRSAAGLVLAAALPLLAAAPRLRGAAALATAGFGAGALAVACAAHALLAAAALAALGRDPTLSGRTAIWRTARELIARRPLFGGGLDLSVSPATAARLQAQFGVNHLHNAGLDILLNFGAAGFALWAAAVWSALALSTQAYGAERRAGVSDAARRTLRLLVLGWLASGLVEDMGVRTQGPMAAVGAAALCSLYGLGAGRRAFRRPAWRFEAARRAPIRPPRLRAGR